jgi:DNA invertase Pin-like site-specific DNA recombinase
MLVGYARCSTDAQDLTAQHNALTTFGVKANRIMSTTVCWHGRDAPQPSI